MGNFERRSASTRSRQSWLTSSTRLALSNCSAACPRARLRQLETNPWRSALDFRTQIDVPAIVFKALTWPLASIRPLVCEVDATWSHRTTHITHTRHFGLEAAGAGQEPDDLHRPQIGEQLQAKRAGPRKALRRRLRLGRPVVARAAPIQSREAASASALAAAQSVLAGNGSRRTI